MTLGAFTHKKEILQSQFEEDTKKIHQGALIMIIPFLTFAGIALKPEKKWPNFHSFNSVSFLAMHPREQFQCLNIVLTNITGPLFLEFTRCAKAILSILKR